MSDSWPVTWLVGAIAAVLGVLTFGHPLGAAVGLWGLLAPTSPLWNREDSR